MNEIKTLRRYEYLVQRINGYSRQMSQLSDEEISQKTVEFKERIAKGESLDDILPEAYALVREATSRFHGEYLRHYDTQIMGGIALHEGTIAELQTGEGKTITALLPAYLHALTGEGVHVVTPNDYLSRRDYEALKPVFEGLGLSVGLITEERADSLDEDASRRREAYRADVTYGSSNALTFDYLRDNTTTRVDRIVRRPTKVGFAIIDEADKILLDDALIPYILSSQTPKSKTPEELALAQERRDFITMANAFAYSIYEKDRRARTTNADHRGVVRLFETKASEDAVTMGDDEVTETTDKRYYAVGSYESMSMNMSTALGWFEAFKYFNSREIDLLTAKMSTSIRESKDLKIELDYVVTSRGIELTDRGLDKAIRMIPEFKELNDNWYSNPATVRLMPYLDNALKAYFIMRKGADYGIMTIEGPHPKRKICSIVSGRMAEGRIYGDGLQEAIEAKEKTLSLLIGDRTPIVATNETITTASITQKAFYALYGGVSGMTGTATQAMSDLYGLDIIRVPRNSGPSLRINMGDTLYLTEEEKIAALVEETIKSYKKGQPVLIATMSVKESELIAKMLMAKGLVVDLLNADVEDKEEARVVQEAGRKGKITVTTQMAGRGTDIKLGGELSSITESLIQQRAKLMAKQISEQKHVTIEAILPGVMTWFRNNKDAMEKASLDAKAIYTQERKEVIASGGLKLIGCGHFQTVRDDLQLVGRTARQSDPGEAVFFTSVKDLEELHVDKETTDALIKKYNLREGNPLQNEVVTETVIKAQEIIEGVTEGVIANNHDKDQVISSIRECVYSQRSSIIKGKTDPSATIDRMIEVATASVIAKNIPEWSHETATTKLAKSEIDLQTLTGDISETFGIEMTPEEITECFETIKDLTRYISEVTRARNDERRANLGTTFQDEDRRMVVQFLDETWISFQQELDFIKFNGLINAMAQNKDFDEKKVIKRTYNQLIIDAREQFVGKMFGHPNKKNEESTIVTDLSKPQDSANAYNIYADEEHSVKK